MRSLLARLLLIGFIFFGLVSFAYAQVSTNYWLLSSGTLKPNLSTWSLTIPQLGGSGVRCLQVTNTGLFQVASGACGSGSGGSDPFTHPSAGVSATTSRMIFENASSTFTGNLNITGNSTTTNASSTNLFATTASTTNLFGQLINGFGLSSCTGTNALTWTGGSFTCTPQPQGTVTSVAATWPVISSGGSTPTITWGGIATSTNLTSGRVHYSTGVNTFADAATSSIASGVGITVTNGSTAYVIGSQPSIACNTATGSVFGCLTAADWTTFNGKLSAADPFTHPSATVSATTTSLLITASTTIGNGTSLTGLTINGDATTTGLFNASSNQFNINSSGAISKIGNGSVSITSNALQLNSSGGDVIIQNNVSTKGSRLKLSTTPVSLGDIDPSSAITLFVGLNEDARLTGNGYLGIGTTSPMALLSLNTQPSASGATTTLFIIASSTAAFATTTLFQIDNQGLASTTNLTISGLGNGSVRCLQISGAGLVSGAAGACATAATVDPFTHAAANSSATTSALGIGTTTPWAQLSVSTSTQSAPTTNLFQVASTTGANLFLVQGNGVTLANGTSTNFFSTTASSTNLFSTSANIGSLTLTCAGCVSNVNLANSTISGIALGSTLANLSATDSTLTFSGIYTGNTARTIGLNLGQGNVWTAASTTFAGNLTIGGNSTTTNATSTNQFATTASSTNLFTASFNGAGLAACTGAGKALTWTGGLFGCNQGFFSAYDAFTHTAANNAATTSAIGIGTTTPWAQLSVSTSTQSSFFTNLFEIASTTGASILKVLGGGLIGVGSSTPTTALSVGTGTASSSILVAEYAYGGATINGITTVATGTAATFGGANLPSNHITWPIGTAAVTFTLCMTPGQQFTLRVVNPASGTAGTITWATCAGQGLNWVNSTVPTQTTTAKKYDIYSFMANGDYAPATSTVTVTISGVQSPNF